MIQEKVELIIESKIYLNIKAILEISLKIFNENIEKITSFFETIHNNEINLLFSFKHDHENTFKKVAAFISWLHSYINYIDMHARFKLILFFVVSFIIIEEYEKQRKVKLNQNTIEYSNMQAFFIERFSKFNRSFELYDINKIKKEEVLDIVYCFQEWIYLEK